jgi:hypothetical protein
MKKYILIMLISSLCFVNAASLVKAKDVRAITNKETKKLEKKLLASANGKKAYNGLVQFFNKKVSAIATNGFYDTFTMTYMGKYPKIEGYLSPLSRTEQDVMRAIIIKKLIKNGYKITYNKFWDNPGHFYISISW